MFNGNGMDWAAIYVLLRLVTCKTYMRPFQYKILSNVLFLDKNFIFWNKVVNTAYFSNLYNKAPFHVFYECDLLNVYGRT